MARQKQEIDTDTLKGLEADLKKYPEIPRIIGAAWETAKYKAKQEDVNSGIKSNWPVSRPTEREVMSKYDHPTYIYYDKLKNDCDKLIAELPPRLARIVKEVYWGDYWYLSKQEIADRYLDKGSERKAYDCRYRILERFAIIRGVWYE